MSWFGGDVTLSAGSEGKTKFGNFFVEIEILEGPSVITPILTCYPLPFELGVFFFRIYVIYLIFLSVL